MFDTTKEKVRIMVRISETTWAGPWTATILANKKKGTKRLIGHGFDFPLTGVKDTPHLLKLRFFQRYRKLYFVEKGTLVEPASSVQYDPSLLITPNSVQQDDEGATLGELSKPTRTRNEQLGMAITYVILGIMGGYILGQIIPFSHFTGPAATVITSTIKTGVGA